MSFSDYNPKKFKLFWILRTKVVSLQRPIRNAGVLARIFGGRGRPRSLMQNGEIAV